MRLSKDYKKLFPRILMVFLVAFLPFVFLFAQTADELKNKINEKNADIERLEAEIKQYQNELNSLGKQKNSLASSIKQLDLTKKKLIANISVTQSKIDKTNLKIKSLSSQISTKEGAISNNIDSISLGIKYMNEIESVSLPEAILSQRKISFLWNDLDSIISVNEAIKGKTYELKEVKSALEDTRKETIDAQKELISLKEELADEKKIVEQNVLEKNKLLKQTKNSETTYQEILKEQLAKKTALEQEVRNYESQLKFILDPSKLPNAGVLSWPLDDVYVTQLFGKTVAAKRLYASGSHSGVDFRASVGTPIKAMADGIILGTGDTDTTCPGASFGKWILIEHNNGLSSAYGHLSLIKVSSGTKVSRGEIIGYSGATGHVTGPHLHVTVYASSAVKVETLPSKSCSGKTLTQPIAAVNAYLDPMYYLPALR